MIRKSASVAGSPDRRRSTDMARGNRRLRGSIQGPFELALKLTITLAFVAGLLVAPGTSASASAAQDVEFMTAATAPSPDAPPPAELSQGELNSAVATARAEWEAAVPGLDLSGVSASIVDLPDLVLGRRLGELDPDRRIRGRAWLGCYEPDHGCPSRVRARGGRRPCQRRTDERVPLGRRNALRSGARTGARARRRSRRSGCVKR